MCDFVISASLADELGDGLFEYTDAWDDWDDWDDWDVDCPDEWSDDYWDNEEDDRI